MDFLQRASQQTLVFYRSMSVQSRILSGLLLGVILISLVFLFRVQAGGGETYLYGGREFSQTELAAMEDALGRSGLNDYEIQGYKMKVPRSQRAEYLRAVSEAGATPKLAYEYDDPERSFNPFMNKEQQRSLEKARNSRKISEMIMGMAGIDRATVHFDESETSGFPKRIERTAVISVKAVGSRALDMQEVTSIRRTAAGMAAGLKEADITVIDDNTAQSYKGPREGDLSNPEEYVYAQAKRYYEDQYRQQIERILRNFNAVVQVHVELDPTLRHRENSRTLETPIVISQESESRNLRTVGGGSGGIPGVLANNPGTGANSAATVRQTQRETTEDETSEQSNSVVGGTIAEVHKAGLVEKSVAVAITVPRSFYEKLWVQRNPPADGESPTPLTPADLATLEAEIKKKVQELVRPLLPKRVQGEDPYDYIVVETDPELTVEPIAAPGMAQHAFAWLAYNWQTLAMLLVGLTGLVMLRGMLKRPAEIAAAAPVIDEAEEEKALQEELAEVEREVHQKARDNKLKRRFGASGRSLKEELVELVEDDIESAASVLRNWIGDSS